jgi:hypothetical protein
MNVFERLLLYVVSLTVGFHFAFERDQVPPAPAGGEAAPLAAAAFGGAGEADPNEVPAADENQPSGADRREPAPGEDAGKPAPQTAPRAPGEPLELVDEQGRTRIRLGFTPAGEPELVLMNPQGLPVVQLQGRAVDGGELRITGSNGAVRLNVADDGSMSVALGAVQDPLVRLQVDALGAAEIAVRTVRRDMQAVLRADRSGGAELTAETADGKSAAAIRIDAEGRTTIRESKE